MRSDRLARAFEEHRSYADGDRIVQVGDEGREMFVIQSGEVVISRREGDRDVEVSILGRGDVFGEMSLLESLPREADATARGPVTLLAMGPGALLVRLRKDPSFAVELLQSMSRRVRELNSRAGAAVDPGTDHRPRGDR